MHFYTFGTLRHPTGIYFSRDLSLGSLGFVRFTPGLFADRACYHYDLFYTRNGLFYSPFLDIEFPFIRKNEDKVFGIPRASL